MSDKRKAYLTGAIIFIAAVLAETITASAAEFHSTAWLESHGQPIITSVEDNDVEFTDAELELIARCVQAEYGYGTELDKRLIVSVILNRLESNLPDFRKMDTVEKVVCAPNQFAVSHYYTLETMNAVYLEIAERTNDRILWFSSRGYLPYGNPILEYNGHFFSGI